MAETEKNPNDPAEDPNTDLEQLKGRIGRLERIVRESPIGGMLSSEDFLELNVSEDNAGDYLSAFNGAIQDADWDKDELTLSIDVNGWDQKRYRFLIKPFDEFNVTPFSYDLSIGKEFYSMRSEGRRSRLFAEEPDGEYNIQPRETVIILTREYIALPPAYAATVWPRFGPVSEGIFQSMVKIDPTWRGHLAVALTNVSPATYPIHMGDTFATLILYELTRKTEFSLCLPRDIGNIEVDLPAELFQKFDHTKRNDIIENAVLADSCEILKNENNDRGRLIIKRGLRKKGKFDKLLNLFDVPGWREAVINAKKEVIGKCKIPVKSYELENLDDILSAPPDGKRLDRSQLQEKPSMKDLEITAYEYGGPCRWLPNLSEFIMDEVKSKIQVEIEASLFPRLVTLTLSVLGMLSLIAAVVSLLVARYRPGSPLGEDINWPGTIAWVSVIIGGVVMICFVFLLTTQFWRRKKVRKN